MSTLTSQMNGVDGSPTKSGFSTLPSRPPPYNGETHVYGELEDPATTLPAGHIPNDGIYRSPTNSSPPDSAKYFDHSSSSAQLLPPLPPARGTSGPRKGSNASTDSSLNESLYNPAFGGSGQYPHALEKIPETGTMFPDPPNPTAFPVNEYECIPGISEYEMPVSSKKQKKVGENPKSRVSIKSLNYETDPKLDLGVSDTADCTADSADMTGDSITGFKLPLANDSTMDSTDVTGATDMCIGLKQGSAAASHQPSSTAEFTSGSSTGGYRSSVVGEHHTGTSEDSIPTTTSNTLDNFTEPKKALQMNGVCYQKNRRSQSHERRSMSQERRSFSREAPSSNRASGLEDNDSIRQLSSDVAFPTHIASNKLHTPPPPPPPPQSLSSTLPQSRPNSRKELDSSSLQPHLSYTSLQADGGTAV